MKYLITGVSGQLGYDIVKELLSDPEAIIFTPNRKEMDLLNENSIRNCISTIKPHVIINCAAYTNVDGAETNNEECLIVNYKSQKVLVEEAKKIDSKIIYISSDYVFDGRKQSDYLTTDYRNPLNMYGLSKLLGEDIIMSYDKSFIVRTSWVFGINGKNFVKTMLKLSDIKEELNVVNDQIGRPTYTKDLAPLIIEMSKTDKYGIYHASNTGYCSWADFARYIMQVNNKKMQINNINSEDFPQKALRPKRTIMDLSQLEDKGFLLLPDWHDAVERYSKELKLQKK